MDRQEALTALVTKDAIAEVIKAYCYHFDRAEPEAVLALFTPGAVVDYGPDVPTMTGLADLRPMVETGLANFFEATSHHVSNIQIRLDGPDRASSVCYVYAWHRYRDGRPTSELWGQYHHEFRRLDGEWKIDRLVLKAAGTENFHRDRMHPIGRRQPPG